MCLYVQYITIHVCTEIVKVPYLLRLSVYVLMLTKDQSL
jgi:hypothetical protein